MPKVSVVIPTYNRADYIEETVNSVLNQTYKDFELIVVDDGSTDNTLEILEKYKNKIKVIAQKNSERAISRNTGVKNSSGEYIAFLDSDDIWIENKLEQQVEILDSKKDVILTNGICLRIDEKGNKTKIAKRQTTGHSGFIYEKLLFRNSIVSPTPLIRRNAFEQTEGFKCKYIPYEDWEMWIRLSLLGEFYFLDKPLAYYRIHFNQSVALVKAEKIEEVTNHLLFDSFKLTEVNEEIKNKALALTNLRYTFWYLVSENYPLAREKIKLAFNYNPNYILDPKWLGLNLLSQNPALNKIANLKQFHYSW